jgi:hypothetical protein
MGLLFVFSVPSVFSVLKAFDLLRDSHAVKSFNTEGTEKTLRPFFDSMERNYERA